jgi:phenylacetic acid degradation operon negative regulatory protein
MVKKSKAVDGRDSGPVAALLGRPLTARSVIASLLLGRHPPSAPASLLVRWCALFGISETSARVALSRMVQRGELDAEGGTYALAGRIRARQAEQDFAIDPVVGQWEGEWLLAIVPRGPRDAEDRVSLRRELERRMVPLRDGVWTRPDNLGEAVLRRSSACGWWVASAADGVDVARIVDAFALTEREARTCELLSPLTQLSARLPDPDVLADAFVAGAAAAQHLRRDPLLPAELLPEAWHADELRAAYHAYLGQFGAAVAAWAGSA